MVVGGKQSKHHKKSLLILKKKKSHRWELRPNSADAQNPNVCTGEVRYLVLGTNLAARETAAPAALLALPSRILSSLLAAAQKALGKRER